jgi:hypothetical protein
MKYNAGKALGRFQRLSMHQVFAICGRVTILENYDQETVEAPKREQIGYRSVTVSIGQGPG